MRRTKNTRIVLFSCVPDSRCQQFYDRMTYWSNKKALLFHHQGTKPRQDMDTPVGSGTTCLLMIAGNCAIRQNRKKVEPYSIGTFGEDTSMAEITDEFMRQMIATTKRYSIVILKAGPKRHEDGVEKIIWEHGRRNFALRADGVLPIVCPVIDGSDVTGVGIFDAPVEEVQKIMDEDPGVKAGVFVYEIHACRSFPGACLPK